MQYRILDVMRYCGAEIPHIQIFNEKINLYEENEKWTTILMQIKVLPAQ